MATVKMKNGNKYADIFDSPETIAQAKKEGFEIVEDFKPFKAEKVEDTDSVEEEKTTAKVVRGRTARQ